MISSQTTEPVVSGRWVGAEEIGELKQLLSRALSTLEPVHWPAWAMRLEQDCDRGLGNIPVAPGMRAP